MLEKQIEVQERLDVLRNDQQVRGSTFHQFGQADAETPKGRFTAHDTATVIGSTATPNYLGVPNWCGADQSLEPPTGVDINAMEPVGQPHELRASIASLGQSVPSPDQASPGRSLISSVQATAPAPDAPQAPPLAADRGAGAFSKPAYRRA